VRAALIALVLAAGSVAQATPSQELDDARSAFRNGQLTIALEKYNALLYPPPPRLASKDEIVEAYVNLGVCRVDAGDLDGARREFEKALGYDPNRQLDPLLVTNKEAIKLFDDTKAEIRNREREREAKEALAKAYAARDALLKNTVVYEPHPFYLNFLPPIGQIQNDDNIKAVLIGSGEVVTLATSAGIWGYLVDKYGLNNSHLNVDRTTAQDIRNLQEIEVGAGVAFLILYGVGVYDAINHYQPQVKRKLDEKMLPPELRDLDKPKTKPKTTTYYLTPMITPNGAGIGIGWEN
jgi:tetratricopeptide (TPR) repeat protein